jgi:predicted small secreted protein
MNIYILKNYHIKNFGFFILKTLIFCIFTLIAFTLSGCNKEQDIGEGDIEDILIDEFENWNDMDPNREWVVDREYNEEIEQYLIQIAYENYFINFPEHKKYAIDRNITLKIKDFGVNSFYGKYDGYYIACMSYPQIVFGIYPFLFENKVYFSIFENAYLFKDGKMCTIYVARTHHILTDDMIRDIISYSGITGHDYIPEKFPYIIRSTVSDSDD